MNKINELLLRQLEKLELIESYAFIHKNRELEAETIRLQKKITDHLFNNVNDMGKAFLLIIVDFDLLRLSDEL